MSTKNTAVNHPFPIKVTKGEKIVWCRCTSSDTQPFCDQSHCVDVQPLFCEASEDTTIELCGCKQTKEPPICDGSHKKLMSFNDT